MMKQSLRMAFSIILVLSLVTACSHDIGEIENQNYATAVGVDFRDGKYYVYIQMLGLASVAKREGGDKGPAEVYVSETSGATFMMHFSKLIIQRKNGFFGHM